MKCKLTIYSEGDGWNDKAECTGDAALNGATLTVDYLLGGDPCRLILAENRAFQTRSGSVGIEISFEEGKETFCVLSGGGAGGGYNIFTRKLAVKFGKFGASALIEYDSGAEIIRLNIKVLYIAD